MCNVNNIVKKLDYIKNYIRSQSEWQNAICWAKMYYPNWVKLATQRKRPEIRETYRKKILREYYDRCW